MAEIRTPGSVRVLHTADLHVDRSFSSWGAAAETRRRDLLDTMEQIGDLARKHEVHLVLLAGDQFDRHNPEAAVISRFHGWLDRLGQAGIQVAMIPGNHDSYWYEDSVYRKRLPSNTVVFRDPYCEEPVHLTIGGQNIWLYGIAHDHTRQREILPGFRRRGDGDVHIGLMHATLDPRQDLDIAERYLPLKSSELSETGLDYIALGHLHSARVINAGRPGMAAYPGSPEPLDLSEIGERSVTMVTFSGGSPDVSTIRCGRRIARREAINCTNLTSEEIEYAIKAYRDESLILSAALTGAPQDIPDVESLRTRLLHYFCHLEIRDRTSVVDAEYVRRIQDERTIRGQFVRRLREKVRAAESERERETAELALQLGLIQLQKRSAE